jgi:hypothetical protein
MGLCEAIVLRLRVANASQRVLYDDECSLAARSGLLSPNSAKMRKLRGSR